ncbi:MAG: ABC transporter ATP-binding protein [Muribaculaceae bacterium]|nr:ABC transporter ATP-binding protein [Muribaculaceae bacterium]MDE6131674.1 ABC transporter ATP-binding protein [Muribaculaceae bacterium]
MIQLKDFSIGYGPRTLLRDVNTSFGKGQLTALIGRNGSGKSTLLRALAGLNRRYSGEIILDGKDIRSLSPGGLARSIAFVTTERTRIPNLRCEDVVAIGRAPYTNWIGRMQESDRQIVMDAISAVGMENYARRTMDTMSDGECQRIMIARALAQDTPAILLDEPTSFLDLPNRYELVSLLHSLAHDKGKCVLFSTHELDVALRKCDCIALVDNGTLYNLTVSEMIQSGHIQRLFSSPNISLEEMLWQKEK